MFGTHGAYTSEASCSRLDLVRANCRLSGQPLIEFLSKLAEPIDDNCHGCDDDAETQASLLPSKDGHIASYKRTQIAFTGLALDSVSSDGQTFLDGKALLVYGGLTPQSATAWFEICVWWITYWFLSRMPRFRWE